MCRSTVRGGAGFSGRALEVAVYGKVCEGASAPDLLDSRPFTSERALVSRFWSCPGSLVPAGRNFGSGCYLRSKFPLCSCFGCMTCGFCSVVSKKQPISC